MTLKIRSMVSSTSGSRGSQRVGAPVVVAQAKQPARREHAPDFAQRSQRLGQVLDAGVGISTVERGIGERQLIQALYFEAGVGKATLFGATAGGLNLARLDVDADDLRGRDELGHVGGNGTGAAAAVEDA